MDLHSGTPFWPTRNGLIATYPPLESDASADVVVIGAGITGALVAHELTKAGASVIVLDGRDVVAGSSAATTGLLLYDTDSSLEMLTRAVGPRGAARAYRLGLDAISKIEALCNECGDMCGFARRPSLYFASDRSGVKSLRKEFELREANGFLCAWLEGASLRSQSALSSQGAIWADGGGEIDCHRFAHRLLAAAVSRGARIFDRTPVIKMTPGADDVRIETLNGHVVRAPMVVCATGYEGTQHAPVKTGKLHSTWVFASEPLDTFDGWPERCLMWETARPYFYARSSDDGRLIAGGEDEPAATSHQAPDKMRAKIDKLLERSRAIFPRLKIEPAYCWAGTFATTEDGLPFIDTWRGAGGSTRIWYTLGYGGNGITFSMIAANIIRDAYLGNPNDDVNLFAFDRRAKHAISK